MIRSSTTPTIRVRSPLLTTNEGDDVVSVDELISDTLDRALHYVQHDANDEKVCVVHE